MTHLKNSIILLTLVASSTALAQVLTASNAKHIENDTQVKQTDVLKCNPSPGTSTVFQSLLSFDANLNSKRAIMEDARKLRAKEVIQDNEYKVTGKEKGIFLENSLMLNGAPLDYGDFTLLSTGELTVVKGGAKIGETVPVPFRVYLRRDGRKLPIETESKCSSQMKVDLSEILKSAEPDDLLVIEAVNEEDGLVKRVLKLINPGC